VSTKSRKAPSENETRHASDMDTDKGGGSTLYAMTLLAVTD
jgi:hypothetical protein